MWILFAVLSVVLLLLLIRQRILYRKLQKEIEYLSNRLTTGSAARPAPRCAHLRQEIRGGC